MISLDLTLEKLQGVLSAELEQRRVNGLTGSRIRRAAITEYMNAIDAELAPVRQAIMDLPALLPEEPSSQEPQQYTERELTKLLRDLPQPISIIERESGPGYVWTWLASRGEATTFLEALDEVLTHIEVSYTESCEH